MKKFITLCVAAGVVIVRVCGGLAGRGSHRIATRYGRGDHPDGATRAGGT